MTNSDSFHQLVKLGFHTNAWDIQEYLKFMQMNDSNDAPPDVGSILCFGHPMVLNFTAAPKTFAQLKAELGKAGDGLYNKIIAYAKEQVQKLACFVAGTLVHTKDGLRPIEEIKVGDYVLSKPESGEGELAYKRVTRTFVHENREVFGVTYEVNESMGQAGLLVTTAEHPFWIPTMRVKDPDVQYGGMNVPYGKWSTAEEMFKTNDNFFKGKGEGGRCYLSAHDGKEYGVIESTPICVTTTKKKRNRLYDYFGPDFGVLWPVTPDFQREAKGLGADFRVSPPVILTNPNNERMTYTTDLDKKSRNIDKASWGAGTTEHYTRGYQPKLCTVYNLEVEDCHTYFVGEHGIWVHNTCADLVNRLPEAKLPSEVTNTYWETPGNITKLRAC